MKKALIILAVIIVHCTLLIDNCMSQWFSQPVPVNGPDVYDLKFFNENTGIITSQLRNVYRTTNGGDNWVLLSIKINMQQLQKIDSNAIYGCGARINGNGVIYRSFNRGETWDSVGISGGIYTGISFINRDTGWVSSWADNPVIYRTINGGVTLTQQSNQAGYGKVFFLPYKVNGEYLGWASNQNGFWNSTNSGVNWSMISNISLQNEVFFKNENTGWQSSGDIYFSRTTNGGFNWQLITMPSIYGVTFNNLKYFKIIDSNYDTIIGSGATRHLGGGIYRGIIWKSTNSGVNWGFQQPDTSYTYNIYKGLDFINSQTGWTSNLHTTNGGGPVIYPTYIDSNSTIIPSEYVLKQNYPNPFNPSTTIEFSIPKDSYIKLKILDLSGKTVLWVVYDMLLYSGLHKFKIVDFEKLNLSSGVYFYQMEARDINTGQTNFIQSRKMILLK